MQAVPRPPERRTEFLRAVLGLACALACAAAAGATAGPPSWAYPMQSADVAVPADDAQTVRIAASSRSYTLGQLRNPYEAADWHPQDHPPLPAVVAHGRPPQVYACGNCHRADGSGTPDNARLAGLSYGYMLQQLADFRSGARRTAVPARQPQALMIALAKALSPDDAREAAAYFSTLKPRRNVRVIESATVPQTIVSSWYLVPAPGGASEPIGERIIEVPEDAADCEHLDAHATFTAYVPPGSLARGAEIVTGAAAGKAPPCAGCHGPGLHGQGNVPGLAGRSPSYVVRQLYDIQTGARGGQAVGVMRGLVARLDGSDIIAVAAYVASLEP